MSQNQELEAGATMKHGFDARFVLDVNLAQAKIVLRKQFANHFHGIGCFLLGRTPIDRHAKQIAYSAFGKKRSQNGIWIMAVARLCGVRTAQQAELKFNLAAPFAIVDR